MVGARERRGDNTRMTCRELIDFLLDYLEGTLAEVERARFDAHLAECPDCVAYLESYAATIRLGRAACAEPEAGPPPEVPEELVRAILAARERGR
jgi:anti-sigma factor RsiW